MASSHRSRKAKPDAETVRDIIKAEVDVVSSKIDSRIGALEAKVDGLSSALVDILGELKRIR